ncbi:MAG: ABC transporter substrate-binding protein [Flexilinea sp.]|nr:ABC transporter substrate-binding protein [Flexilinea sp.]
MKKTLVVLLALVMVLSLCLTASAKREDVTIITQVSPDSLDPQGTTMMYAYQVLYNCFDSLMTRDVNNNIVPGLAESYTVSDDSKEFTFQLRKGVKFHNGAEMTADDVVFSFERAIGLSLANTDIIEKVEAVGDYEVKITLKNPNAVFLSILTLQTFFILNREATEAAGDSFGRNPIGTGAYKFVEWVEGEYVKLEAFEDYYLGAPEIKEATYKFIGDSNTALIAVESGDADYTYVYPESAKEEVEFNDDLKLFNYNHSSLYFFTMNVKTEYLSNKLVRQAINLAANREDMVIVALEGNGRPSDQICNVGFFGYVDEVYYPHDVEKAKELLAEAGYPDGFTLHMIAQDEQDSKMAQVLADNLREIGINTEIEMQESNTAIANYMAGNYEIGTLGIGNAMQDLDMQKRLFTPGNSLNLSQADESDEQLVKIYNTFVEASQVIDPDTRLEIYKGLNREIADAAYYVPAFFPYRSHLMSSSLDVEGIRPIGIVLVKELHWND